MRCLSSFVGAVLLVLVSVTAVMAQVPSEQTDSNGAWVGALFWTGFTLLLLFGAIVIAYQSMKRPNRR